MYIRISFKIISKFIPYGSTTTEYATVCDIKMTFLKQLR